VLTDRIWSRLFRAGSFYTCGPAAGRWPREAAFVERVTRGARRVAWSARRGERAARARNALFTKSYTLSYLLLSVTTIYIIYNFIHYIHRRCLVTHRHILIVRAYKQTSWRWKYTASAVSLFCSASQCGNPAATSNRCIFSNNNPIILIFGEKFLHEYRNNFLTASFSNEKLYSTLFFGEWWKS